MFKNIIRLFATLSVVALAAFLAWSYYFHYMRHPWTRDGQLQTYVVGVAPRVSGPVVNVGVKDGQFVKKGDLLFAIDKSDYMQEFDEANAALKKSQTTANLRKAEMDHRTELMDKRLISLEDYQIYQAKYAEALADIDLAKAKLELAQLHLSYTDIYSPIDGYITNLVVANGTYVDKGKPLMAVVDADNFWVAGYFRETELNAIKAGQRAKVVFMGYGNKSVIGTVDAIGWGIFREDGAAAANMLPKVAPTVDWVRLSQRFPVRIVFDEPLPREYLRIGLTTSVFILPDDEK